MISSEPTISVGIFEHEPEVRGSFNGTYELPSTIRLTGEFRVAREGGTLVLYDDENIEVMRGREVECWPLGKATFTLRGVTIGVKFHWERREDQAFEGALRLVPGAGGTITAINTLSVERYLTSVISSEMSADAPLEFLKAHAITSRSWLIAMLEKQRQGKNLGVPSLHSRETEEEVIRWYDREDHSLFDVCADDHCQRYQGVTRIISGRAAEAIEATRGVLLVFGDEVCDARYYKACGGLTENFESAWEDSPVPYLQSVPDAEGRHAPIASEEDAERWIRGNPESYCNSTDGALLRRILPSFDLETTDFFRWRVEYSASELAEIIRSKSGVDFGDIRRLIPVQRGPSGRLVRLRIEGSRATRIVGKELEIRRWLSPTHLYSSAFVVDVERGKDGAPVKFALHGAGWGHGVGFCQIGAAVRASQGRTAEEIVRQYFTGAELRKLY